MGYWKEIHFYHLQFFDPRKRDDIKRQSETVFLHFSINLLKETYFTSKLVSSQATRIKISKILGFEKMIVGGGRGSSVRVSRLKHHTQRKI
mgnify:CR=1 FL=1